MNLTDKIKIIKLFDELNMYNMTGEDYEDELFLTLDKSKEHNQISLICSSKVCAVEPLNEYSLKFLKTQICNNPKQYIKSVKLKFKNKIKEPSTSRFSVAYMSAIITLAQEIGEGINITVAKDFPTEIIIGKEDDLYFKVVLAPRLEEK
jgi:hypothetical protein